MYMKKNFVCKPEEDILHILHNMLQSISERHDESGDANVRKQDLSMKYFRSRDQIVLMRRSKYTSNKFFLIEVCSFNIQTQVQ